MRGLSEALREAVAESKLAYELNANSYSYSCLSAWLAAEQALEVLRDALDDGAERRSLTVAPDICRRLSGLSTTRQCSLVRARPRPGTPRTGLAMKATGSTMQTRWRWQASAAERKRWLAFNIGGRSLAEVAPDEMLDGKPWLVRMVRKLVAFATTEGLRFGKPRRPVAGITARRKQRDDSNNGQLEQEEADG